MLNIFPASPPCPRALARSRILHFSAFFPETTPNQFNKLIISGLGWCSFVPKNYTKTTLRIKIRKHRKLKKHEKTKAQVFGVFVYLEVFAYFVSFTYFGMKAFRKVAPRNREVAPHNRKVAPHDCKVAPHKKTAGVSPYSVRVRTIV